MVFTMVFLVKVQVIYHCGLNIAHLGTKKGYSFIVHIIQLPI